MSPPCPCAHCHCSLPGLLAHLAHLRVCQLVPTSASLHCLFLPRFMANLPSLSPDGLFSGPCFLTQLFRSQDGPCPSCLSPSSSQAGQEETPPPTRATSESHVLCLVFSSHTSHRDKSGIDESKVAQICPLEDINIQKRKKVSLAAEYAPRKVELFLRQGFSKSGGRLSLWGPCVGGPTIERLSSKTYYTELCCVN